MKHNQSNILLSCLLLHPNDGNVCHLIFLLYCPCESFCQSNNVHNSVELTIGKNWAIFTLALFVFFTGKLCSSLKKQTGMCEKRCNTSTSIHLTIQSWQLCKSRKYICRIHQAHLMHPHLCTFSLHLISCDELFSYDAEHSRTLKLSTSVIHCTHIISKHLNASIPVLLIIQELQKFAWWIRMSLLFWFWVYWQYELWLYAPQTPSLQG